MRRSDHTSKAPGEAGFALILALLALVLLTFLGLTLSLTTSTELQIATNYRWSQQAYYNAEAGIELGKRYLRQYEWATILPGARPAGSAMSAPPSWDLSRPGESGDTTRNFENSGCDTTGRIGYGVVFDHPTFAAPFQNTTNFFGQRLNGSFTIWVRRKLQYTGGAWLDDPSNNSLILTAEGTAPLPGGVGAAVVNRSIRIVEVELQRVDPAECENYTGQVGSGPTGAGYDPCSAVQPEGIASGTAGATTREVTPGVR